VVTLKWRIEIRSFFTSGMKAALWGISEQLSNRIFHRFTEKERRIFVVEVSFINYS
jgi:hypothetical protein